MYVAGGLGSGECCAVVMAGAQHPISAANNDDDLGTAEPLGSLHCCLAYQSHSSCYEDPCHCPVWMGVDETKLDYMFPPEHPNCNSLPDRHRTFHCCQGDFVKSEIGVDLDNPSSHCSEMLVDEHAEDGVHSEQLEQLSE